MLLVGLAIYYTKEGKQRNGELLFEQTVQFSGESAGISVQGAKVESQRILWVKTSERLRGLRIDHLQYKKLQGIGKQLKVNVWAAPRVEGSATLWLVKLVVAGELLIDRQPS